MVADCASGHLVALVDRGDRIYAVLHTLLRQRFPDMLHVGFEILKVHPSSSWLDPTFMSQKETLAVVAWFHDPILRSTLLTVRLLQVAFHI